MRTWWRVVVSLPLAGALCGAQGEHDLQSGPVGAVDALFASFVQNATIRIVRTGGFAGVYEEWWIRPGGWRESPRGERVLIDPTRLRSLAAAFYFQQASWQDHRKLPPWCFDCFTYEVTVQVKNGAGRIFRIADTDLSDRSLKELLQAVQDIIGPG